METSCSEVLHEVAADVLEKLAFLFADPSDVAELECPDGPLIRAAIRFEGHMTGSIELLSSAAVGRDLAGNMLGIDTASVSDAQARDATGELMNVLCGQLLTRLAGTEPTFSLHPPQAVEADPDAWDALHQCEDVLGMLIDDQPVLVRAHIESSSC